MLFLVSWQASNQTSASTAIKDAFRFCRPHVGFLKLPMREKAPPDRPKTPLQPKAVFNWPWPYISWRFFLSKISKLLSWSSTGTHTKVPLKPAGLLTGRGAAEVGWGAGLTHSTLPLPMGAFGYTGGHASEARQSLASAFSPWRGFFCPSMAIIYTKKGATWLCKADLRSCQNGRYGFWQEYGKNTEGIKKLKVMPQTTASSR